MKQPGKLGATTSLAVFRLTDDGFENVTAKVRAGETLPEGQYLVGSTRAGADRRLVRRQVLRRSARSPGVTEKFLEITMERLPARDRRPVRQARARRVHRRAAPGAGRRAALDGRICRELFQKRWGYDLMEHLPSLVRPVGDWKRVRHNY